MLKKVITGGQTGIDQITLQICRAHNFPTGGTAAQGWLTEIGPAPWLADYGLVECDEEGYPARTEKNIMDCDGMVLFGDMKSPGSKLAIKLCRKHKKFYIENPSPIELRVFVEDQRIGVLNVGGNRASTLSNSDKDFSEASINGFLNLIGYPNTV